MSSESLSAEESRLDTLLEREALLEKRPSSLQLEGLPDSALVETVTLLVRRPSFMLELAAPGRRDEAAASSGPSSFSSTSRTVPRSEDPDAGGAIVSSIEVALRAIPPSQDRAILPTS